MSRRERIAWIALVAGALLLRLVALGARPPHHDEAIHCDFAYNLLHSGIYRYDPTYHGPLLYFILAPLLGLLGETTGVARLYPALAGAAFAGLPFLLRRRIGAGAAWWTGLLLAISPNLVYYSRFARSDVPVELFTAGALTALLLVRTRGWRTIRWVGALAAAHVTSLETFYVTMPLLGVASAAVAIRNGVWASLHRTLEWLERYRFALGATLAWFVATTIAAYTVLFTHPEDWAYPVKAITYWWHQHEVQRVGGPWNFHLVRLAAYEFLPIAAALAWLIRRAGRAGWRRLLDSTTLGEFFLRLLRLVWSVLLAPRLRRIELFCLAWGIAAVAMYAYLGEKTPWLVVHQIVPFLPLAGAQLARTFSSRGRWWSRGLAAAGLAATAWSTVASNYLYPTISTSDPHHAELLVFVQTTPEEQDLARRGLALAKVPRNGPVAAVYGEGSWPLSWQWKKLNVWWAEPEPGMRPAFVVCDPDQEVAVRRRLGVGYHVEEIPLRAWWVEDLSRLTPESALRWFFLREPWSPVGATDVKVFEDVNS